MSRKAAPVIDLTGEDSPRGKSGSRKAKVQRRSSKEDAGVPGDGEVVVVSDDEVIEVAETRTAGGAAGTSGRRSGKQAAKAQPVIVEQQPPWIGMSGTKRIATELKMLQSEIDSGQAPVYDLETVGDDITKWRMKMKDFDDDTAGGRQLNTDLKRLARVMGGQDYLQLEINFPKAYPNAPFALRLVTPRCCWYTGHVTAGGSVCVEALSQTGSANSWRADYCVSGLLPMVKQNMIDVDAVFIRTASGPGGMAGPLRVDLESIWGTAVSKPYSEHEAQAAFARAEAHHRSVGW